MRVFGWFSNSSPLILEILAILSLTLSYAMILLQYFNSVDTKIWNVTNFSRTHGRPQEIVD
jgi:hypothetical protein